MMHFENKILTTPNILTFLRFIIIFFLFWSWFSPTLFDSEITRILVVIFLFTVGSITDFLDGYWARRYKEKSAVGAFMDPLVDKLFILSLFCSYLFIDLINIWWGFIAAIVVREVFITWMRIQALLNQSMMVTEKHGKIKMTIQIIAQSAVWIYILLLSITYDMGVFQEYINTLGLKNQGIFDIPFTVYSDFYVNILIVDQIWIDVLQHFLNYIFGFTAAFTVYSGVSYIMKSIRLKKNSSSLP